MRACYRASDRSDKEKHEPCDSYMQLLYVLSNYFPLAPWVSQRFFRLLHPVPIALLQMLENSELLMMHTCEQSFIYIFPIDRLIVESQGAKKDDQFSKQMGRWTTVFFRCTLFLVEETAAYLCFAIISEEVYYLEETSLSRSWWSRSFALEC